MYSEKLLEHFRNPRNTGQLPPPAITVEASNPVCGDILKLSVRLENGAITEARFLAKGCTASIAMGSALTEFLIGKTPATLTQITAEQLESLVGGLPLASRHAATLCVDAIKLLLKQM